MYPYLKFQRDQMHDIRFIRAQQSDGTELIY